MPDAAPGVSTRAGARRELAALQTARLSLRRLAFDDAPFILRLLNEPSWLRFIGDKGVRTLEDAERYLREGPMAMYERTGYGLLRVALRTGVPIGLCGLIKRDTLADVDIGFALLPEYWRGGYAFEAARAVLDFGLSDLALARIVAITAPDNARSIRLLERLGLAFEANVRLAGADEEIALYAIGAPLGGRAGR
jgi:RimJ/RimL family protein N-acetyltransferase